MAEAPKPQFTPEEFKTIFSKMPVMAVEIVAYDTQRFLVGTRTNRPAQHWGFVPGARLKHGETIAEAFRRVSKLELGRALPFKRANLLGVFQHFWRDNYYGDRDYGTHYVTQAYAIEVDPAKLKSLPKDQHAGYAWVDFTQKRRPETLHPISWEYGQLLKQRIEANWAGQEVINALIHEPMRLPPSLESRPSGQAPK